MSRELIERVYREYETATTREIALAFGISRIGAATMFPVSALARDERERYERMNWGIDYDLVRIIRRRLTEWRRRAAA